MRTFGVKAILDYSVEADLKQTDVENVENVTRINSQTEVPFTTIFHFLKIREVHKISNNLVLQKTD